MRKPAATVGGLDQFEGFVGGLRHAGTMVKARRAGKQGADKIG